MAKHIDKYGRAWQFKPAHDTAKMVKVSSAVMERFILADRILSGNATNDYANYFTGAIVDCYILRGGNEVYTGARYGDEGADYYSSLINNKCVLLKLLQYLHGATDVNNFRAIVELFPNICADSLEP